VILYHPRFSVSPHRMPLIHPSQALRDLIVAFAGRLVCGVRGHMMVRRFEPERLSLRCLLCGAETTGWRLGQSRLAGRPAPTVLTARTRAARAPRAVLSAAASAPQPARRDAA
jgi:hypothetical protein